MDDRLKLFKAADKYLKEKLNKDLMAVDMNTCPSGYLAAYARGEGKAINIKLEELDLFMATEIPEKKSPPVETPDKPSAA